MPSLRDTIPSETFRRLVAVEPGDGDAFEAIMEDDVRPALSRMLLSLRDEGRLSPIPNSAGHRTFFIYDWNSFVEGRPFRGMDTPEHRLGRILRRIETPLVEKPAYYAESVAKGKPPEEAERRIADMEARMRGMFETGAFRSEGYETCEATGEAYFTHWDGFQPRLFSRKGNAFVEIEAFERPAHRSFEIAFETGDLVVSNWIMIPEFTAIVDRNRKPDELMSVVGREAMTRRYAEEHGFVGVYAESACARVYVEDGCVVAGHPDPNEHPDVPEVGTLLGSYRGVTVIDRARLVAIVARKLGEAKAEARVAEYLADPGNDVLRVRVEPGTHHVYFSGDPATFGEAFRPADIDLALMNPSLVISSRALDLDASPGLAP